MDYIFSKSRNKDEDSISLDGQEMLNSENL